MTDYQGFDPEELYNIHPKHDPEIEALNDQERDIKAMFKAEGFYVIVGFILAPEMWLVYLGGDEVASLITSENKVELTIEDYNGGTFEILDDIMTINGNIAASERMYVAEHFLKLCVEKLN